MWGSHPVGAGGNCLSACLVKNPPIDEQKMKPRLPSCCSNVCNEPKWQILPEKLFPPFYAKTANYAETNQIFQTFF
jgi:hypothetical protein